MSIEKYKLLFDYSQSALKEGIDRFKYTEQKASSYLSVLTLLLAGAGFFANWVLERFVPPGNWIEWLLFSLSTLIVICLAAGWFFLFRTLRLTELYILPLDDNTLKFFQEHEDVDVYFYMSETISKGLAENHDTIERKITNLRSAYRIICFTVVLLLAFAGLYSYQRWHMPPKDKNMAEQNTTEKPASQPSGNQPEPSQPVNKPADVSPTPGVTPPDMGSATHGATPPVIRDPGPSWKRG